MRMHMAIHSPQNQDIADQLFFFFQPSHERKESFRVGDARLMLELNPLRQ